MTSLFWTWSIQLADSLESLEAPRRASTWRGEGERAGQAARTPFRHAQFRPRHPAGQTEGALLEVSTHHEEPGMGAFVRRGEL